MNDDNEKIYATHAADGWCHTINASKLPQTRDKCSSNAGCPASRSRKRKMKKMEILYKHCLSSWTMRDAKVCVKRSMWHLVGRLGQRLEDISQWQ